jgi:hypothetical protein
MMVIRIAIKMLRSLSYSIERTAWVNNSGVRETLLSASASFGFKDSAQRQKHVDAPSLSLERSLDDILLRQKKKHKTSVELVDGRRVEDDERERMSRVLQYCKGCSVLSKCWRPTLAHTWPRQIRILS